MSKNIVFKAVAKVAEIAARSAAGSASLAGCHQPKEPSNLKVMLKKNSK